MIIYKTLYLGLSQPRCTSNIGLSAKIDQITEITGNFSEEDGWEQDKIASLLDALSYSKLGRILQEEVGKPKVFSFVHRRFHEYFCARYIKQQLTTAPIERFAEDDRWREVLVLLCEVLPAENLETILELIKSSLNKGEKSESGSIEHKKAIETIRFLRDGFRSRINDIPQDIRLLCSNFIKEQFQKGNPLDQKRSTEAISIVDDSSIHSILELALNSKSPRVRETAIQSCRILRSVPTELSKEIRKYLFQRYDSFQSLRDYATYSVLFSSPPALNSCKIYLQELYCITLIQYFFLAAIYLVFINLSPIRVVSFIFVQLLILSLIPFMSNSLMRKLGTWIGFWFIAIYFNLTFSITDRLFLIPKGYYIPILSAFFIILNIILKDMILNYPIGFQTIMNYPYRFIRSVYRLTINKNSILVSCGIIVMYGAFLLLIDLSKKAYGIIVAEKYSIYLIYSGYGIFITSLVIIGVLVAALISIGLLFGSLWVSYEFILDAKKLISDQIKLKSISISPDNRPKTTTEAIQLLHSFKSDWCRVQYAHALLKWLPSGEEPQLLIEEANKIRDSRSYDVEVTDALYALAEVWEDSMPK